MVFKNISPNALEDPHVLPKGAEGPYIIDGQNRFLILLIFILIFLFRFVICREIIANREHKNLDLFRKFECEIFCFKHPDAPEQVRLYQLP